MSLFGCSHDASQNNHSLTLNAPLTPIPDRCNLSNSIDGQGYKQESALSPCRNNQQDLTLSPCGRQSPLPPQNNQNSLALSPCGRNNQQGLALSPCGRQSPLPPQSLNQQGLAQSPCGRNNNQERLALSPCGRQQSPVPTPRSHHHEYANENSQQQSQGGRQSAATTPRRNDHVSLPLSPCGRLSPVPSLNSNLNSTMLNLGSINDSNVNHAEDINELIFLIEQELFHILNGKNFLYTKRNCFTYSCQHIFNGEIFTDIYTGKDLLHSSVIMNRVVFDGLQKPSLNINDVYVRTGQFTNCIKKHIYDTKYLIPKKYIEANTFSRNLKLGFTVKSINAQKRSISYIKFVESLEALKNVLNGNITSSMVSSRASSQMCSPRSPRASSQMCSPRSPRIFSDITNSHSKLSSSFQFMSDLRRLLPLDENGEDENAENNYNCQQSSSYQNVQLANDYDTYGTHSNADDRSYSNESQSSHTTSSTISNFQLVLPSSINVQVHTNTYNDNVSQL